MGLTLVGLGINSGDLSVAAFEAIKSADAVFLRTDKTRSASFLKENKIAYGSFDDLYEKYRSFERMTAAMVRAVKAALKSFANVVYAVDGALSEDNAAKKLACIRGVRVFEGASKAGNALALCSAPQTGFTAVSAYEKDLRDLSFPLVVYDLDSKLSASAWKLKLFDLVGEELPVKLLIGGDIKKIPLYEIDNFEGYDYSTVLVVEGAPLTKKERFTISDLYDILYILRSPKGCPWDREQTIRSIRRNMIEEAYELVDAIDSGDDDKMKEEIGDVLMQVAFHTVFAEERGAFDRTDVVSELCRKLIDRHTHVFGGDEARDGASALEVWDKNKQKEKGYESAFDYVSALPKVFPAAMRAEKTYKRSKKKGFVYGSCSAKDIGALAGELTQSSDKEEAAGALMYAAVAFVKEQGVSAEDALAKFIDEYLLKLRAVEIAVGAKGAGSDKIFDVKKLYDDNKKS